MVIKMNCDFCNTVLTKTHPNLVMELENKSLEKYFLCPRCIEVLCTSYREIVNAKFWKEEGVDNSKLQ